MKHRPTQRGAALLMLMMSLVIAGLGFMLIQTLNPDARLRAQDEATDAALAMAKAVLIGYASSAAMSKTSVGNLLCPDLNDDGIAYSTGFGCAGTANQSLRLGRMPWRTLGSPEMRDGSGARLWYAVSDNFRSFQPAASNSDTSGTITIRDVAGNILHDASTGNGVAAVIIAPGPPLTTPRLQKRPSNNAADYLDIALGEDNASFKDSTTDGFIIGPVRASDGQIISNDRMVVITLDELLAATEKRIAGEVRNCLIAWAEANNDQFPPPAPIESTDTRGVSGTLFGRVPLTMPRNYAQTMALSLAQLDAARIQFNNATPQPQRAATLTLNRAHKSLITATSSIATTANKLQSLSGTALQTQIEATGLDPLITINAQGQKSAASTLALDPGMTATIADAFQTMATAASVTFTYATSATTAAESLLKKSSATLIKTLTDNTTNALISAANIVLADRTATIKSAWPTAAPDCSWLDPDKKPISGWANNQWNKHLYYQIDQRNLIRDSNANIAAGALTINDRPGYQLIVIAAGRALATQTRTTPDPVQFFEGKNAHASRTGGATNPSKAFEQRPVSNTFNDQLAY